MFQERFYTSSKIMSISKPSTRVEYQKYDETEEFWLITILYFHDFQMEGLYF
jgi:hypothetical protein